MPIALFIPYQNMSLVNSLIGRKSATESTTVSAIPAIASPMGIALKKKVLQNDPKDKKKTVREDETDSKGKEGLIPDDAEKVDATSGMTTDDLKDKSSDEAPRNVAKQPQSPQEPMLDTSLALVAPDSTPNWNVPLSGAQVPKSTSVPAIIPPTTAIQPPDEQSAINKPPMEMSVESLMRMSRHTPTNGQSVRIPGITEDLSSSSEPAGDLVGRGKPMPPPTSSNSSTRALSRFNFNG
jgi:hypothetical protein